MKENFKDWTFNTWLQIYNRLFSNGKKYELSLVGLKLDYITNFQGNFAENGRWMKNLWWGSYAKDEKTSWMDEEMVDNRTGHNLVLKTHYKPKVNEHTGETMPYARGSIQMRKTITNYGYVEVKAAIKPASGIWHAPLWFITENKVLPEIDVAEVYSKNNPNKLEAKSNIHYGTDYEENSKNTGARTHYTPNITNRAIAYGLLWEEDAIEIYYNRRLQRRITDKGILKRMKDHGIIPIINTSVNPNHDHESSEMVVYNMKIYKET